MRNNREKMERTQKGGASPNKALWVLLMLSNNLILPVISTTTNFENEKNYCSSPTDPHVVPTPSSGVRISLSHGSSTGGGTLHPHHGSSHGSGSGGGSGGSGGGGGQSNCSPSFPRPSAPPTPSGGHYYPTPTPTPPSGGHYYPTPTPTPPSGGHYYPTPTPPHGGGGGGGGGRCRCPSPSPPPARGGGGGYYQPPPTSTPVIGNPPSSPLVPSPPYVVTPVAPIVPSPPLFPPSPSSPFDPNTPPFPCTYWGSHPGLIFGVLGWWATVGGVFGVTTLPGLSAAEYTLPQVLSSPRNDGYSSLYREGTASFLNSMATKRFPFSPKEVKDAFLSSLSSDKTAAAQAKLFKLANEGKLKL